MNLPQLSLPLAAKKIHIIEHGDPQSTSPSNQWTKEKYKQGSEKEGEDGRRSRDFIEEGVCNGDIESR